MLAAVIPVCAGINLEYFFSRIDPRRYGAGTKLPHNVNGLLGVCNGIEGDLLTGLPTQMTEIHDPVRLLDRRRADARDRARGGARASRRSSNGSRTTWVRYACVHPESRRVWIFDAWRRCEPLDALPAPARAFASSLEAARQGRDNLPPSFIVPRSRPP